MDTGIIMTTRVLCGGCGKPDLLQLLDLGASPLADRFLTAPDDPEISYDLKLLGCQHCQLVQLSEIVPDYILWSDYTFYSGTSPGLVSYMERFAKHVQQHHRAPDKVLEIACNDGTLLDMLPGKLKVGIDAAAGPVEVAQNKGLDVRLGLFGAQTAESLRDRYGPFDLIVAQNVMAHVTDLADFITGIRTVLAPGGQAIIEVQALEDLILGNQFDHIYHEHRFFFSKCAVVDTLTRYGLRPMTVTKTPMQGGSHRIVCELATRSASWQMYDPGIAEVDHLADSLQHRADYLKQQLRTVMVEQPGTNVIAGWAATAKSATLLNWTGVGEHLSYILDLTPAKIGKFTPGSHIPVVGPGDRPDPDAFLLLAHNYINRIRYDGFKGKWIVPIPIPVVM